MKKTSRRKPQEKRKKKDNKKLELHTKNPAFFP